MIALIINSITVLCLGIIVYEIVSKICDLIFTIKMHEHIDYNHIEINSDKDLQKFLKQLEVDFKKI